MLYNHSPSPAGSPSCGCPVVLAPDGAEQHRDTCTVFDMSRARRDRDRADLAGRAPGWRTVRALDASEVDDATEATGVRVPQSRRGRRHWSVEVTRRRVGDVEALVRTFRLDGRPLAVVADEIPAAADAR